MNLKEILKSQTSASLKPIARLIIGKAPPTRKAEVVATIHQALTNPQTLRSLWEKLDEQSQQSVARALYNGGELNTIAFSAQFGDLPARKKRKDEWSYRYDPLLLGVFFIDGWTLPDDLLPLLRAWISRPPAFQTPTKEALPDELLIHGFSAPLTRTETERGALHDFTAMLRLIQDGKVNVSARTGAPTAATVRKLTDPHASPLLIRDYYPFEQGARADSSIRPFGLIIVMQAAGLAKSEGSKLTLTRKGNSWVKKAVSQDATAANLRQAFSRWIKSKTLNELRRIKPISGQTSRGARFTPPATRREAILNTLRECAPGQWIEIEDFFRTLKVKGHDFSVESGKHSRLYVGHREYGWLGSLSNKSYWYIVQGQYILAVLFEYLACFGIVDIAYVHPDEADYPLGSFWGGTFSQYDGLKYIRLTPLGEYLLGLSPAYAGPPPLAAENLLKILPDGKIEITAPEKITPNDRQFLKQITHPVEANIYALHLQNILSTFESGVTLDTIIDFLNSKSGQSIPEDILFYLEEAHYDSQVLEWRENAILLRATDSRFIEVIKHNNQLSKYCMLTEKNNVIVPVSKEKAFRQQLKKLGFGIKQK